ncbi:MAG: hypothetical protein IT223_04470 [Crocinitomicaceae bacterium]|nr:hypothetical protein [Crocinitomicaceae bacterium]
MTKKTICYSVVLIIIVVAIILGVRSKNSRHFLPSKKGVVLYEVSFPYSQSSLIMELYPKEMVLEFSGNRFHTSLKSAYGVVATEFIIDNTEKTFTQLLKSFSEKFSMKLSEPEAEEWLKQYPGVRIVPTDIKEEIAGYQCKKSIAYFVTDSIPPIELYTTTELKIPTSNWWNQFKEVDGFLMGYEFEQYGKRMKLRAKEVRFEDVSEEKFIIPKEYKPLGITGMKHQIETLLSEYLN